MTLAFDLQEKNSLEEYNDIDNSEWYYQYLEYSAQYIPKYRLPVQYPSMEPYLSTTSKFLPNNDAVRMHIAEAMVKIKIEKENLKIEVPNIVELQNSLLETFNDTHYQQLFVMHRGQPASNAVRMFEYTWLSNKLELMQGDENGYFLPYNHITRAELVTVIDRVLKQSENTN